MGSPGDKGRKQTATRMLGHQARGKEANGRILATKIIGGSFCRAIRGISGDLDKEDVKK